MHSAQHAKSLLPSRENAFTLQLENSASSRRLANSIRRSSCTQDIHFRSRKLFSVDDDETLQYYKSIGINIKAVKGKFSTKEERNNWLIENTKKAVEDMAF